MQNEKMRHALLFSEQFCIRPKGARFCILH
jgi:hypothetical protein